MRNALVGCLLLLCVTACSHPKPPPVTSFTLAAFKADYRDTGAPKTSVCGAEPKPLAHELEGMNTLLSGFLESTSAPPEGVWTDEHVALLTDGVKSLPPALDAYQAELTQALKCKFDKKLGFADLDKAGEELIRQSRKRIADAPALLSALGAKKALKGWHDGLAAEQESAKGQWCPPKPKPGSAEVYYAFKDEKGHSEWLFCDGAKVQAEASASPEFVPPAGDKKKHKAKPYLEASAKYPATEVHQAPAGPAAGAEKAKSADDKDKVDVNNPPAEP